MVVHSLLAPSYICFITGNDPALLIKKDKPTAQENLAQYKALTLVKRLKHGKSLSLKTLIFFDYTNPLWLDPALENLTSAYPYRM
jgi:hypothetical protein